MLFHDRALIFPFKGACRVGFDVKLRLGIIVIVRMALSSIGLTREHPLPINQQSKFNAAELAVALSHYELGVIESITDFRRGSRRSPKVGIVAERGKFLLKRRSLEHVHPDRIRFAHQVQMRLVVGGFPTPKLVPTRRGTEWLQVRDHVYELFEFVVGEPFLKTPEEAKEGGAVLARFHGLTEAFSSPLLGAAPQGDYHDTAGVRTGLYGIGGRLKSHDSFVGHEAELSFLVDVLRRAYDDAADRVNQAGFNSLAERIIHGDWHPGNLIFRHQQIVGVIDYDAVRVSRRVIDMANGVMQFSMLAGGDPDTWPDELDEARFKAFLAGYKAHMPMTEAELACLAPLMIEALIGECVPPITQTGTVGPWSGFRVLQMVKRKVAWMANNGHRLV